MSDIYPAKSSGLQTSDGVIAARTSVLHSVVLIGDGTNACNVVIYDNATTNSGTVLAKVSLPASAGTFELFHSSFGVEALNGIYADVSGTGAAYVVHYTLK